MSLLTFAKQSIVKDLDGDGKFDKVSINFETNKIEFLLSDTEYKKQSSLAFHELDHNARLRKQRKVLRLSIK